MNVDPNSDFAISLIVLGLIIGAIVGATAGGLCLTGGMRSVFSKFTTDLFALSTFGTPIGTWEDYAIAFIFGGFLDIFVRPLANQIVRIGTGREKKVQLDKYGYDFVTRGLTYGIKGPWKAFARGGARGYWDLYRRGEFNNQRIALTYGH